MGAWKERAVLPHSQSFGTRVLYSSEGSPLEMKTVFLHKELIHDHGSVGLELGEPAPLLTCLYFTGLAHANTQEMILKVGKLEKGIFFFLFGGKS